MGKQEQLWEEEEEIEALSVRMRSFISGWKRRVRFDSLRNVIQIMTF
jgi:hypothetical protein